jgi:hypothetical protein
MAIINDDSRVVNKLETSLNDDDRVVIYDRHMFIIVHNISLLQPRLFHYRTLFSPLH